MEDFFLWVLIFSTALTDVAYGKDSDTGIIVSIFPNPYLPTWYPGQLLAYSDDVDSLITKGDEATYRTYSFKSPSTSVVSMAVDVRNQSLYYLDVNTKTIYRTENFSFTMDQSKIAGKRIQEGVSQALCRIAFDWISQNIYWTDRYHNWIAVRPTFSNDTLMYRVVLQDQIVVPIGLAVDPVAGYLFWSDTTPSGRIERSNLLGEHRTVLISDSIGFPTAIVIDHVERSIYWSDYTRYTIERVSYDGQNRKVIHRKNGYPFADIFIYKVHICVTEHTDNRLMCYDKEGKIVWSDKYGYWNTPYAAVVYDPDVAPELVHNNCKSLSCDHFCIHTPDRGRCMCKEGYTLKDENGTCEASHSIAGKGLLFTNGTNVCLVDIHAITGADHTPQCIISNLNHTKYLQPDTVNGNIYFTNTSSKTIRVITLQTGDVDTVTSTGEVSGLFYDWVSRDLYWSEYDTNTIKVKKANSVFKSTVRSNVLRASNLLGNPHNYSLYWMSGEDTYSYLIEGGTMSGDERYTIVENKNLNTPVGLYYDEVYAKIFWTDEEEVKSINIKTRTIETYLSVGNVNNILIYKDYIIWTTDKSDIRVASVVSSEMETQIDLVKHGAVTSMCIYDPRLQRPERGPCEDDNGGCEEICVPTRKGAICKCTFGLQLHDDGKRCKSVHRTTQFALVADITNHKIFQIPTKDTVIRSNAVVALDIPSISYPHGAIYDPKSDYVYWTEIPTQQIRRSKLDGQNETIIYTFEKHFADRLVIDESTGNLYFTAQSVLSTSGWPFYKPIGYVGVLRLSDDPEHIKHRTLISDLQQPRSLALYPPKGYLFWGELGNSDASKYIGRSDMDGKNQKRIIVDVGAALGLAVDYNALRLYWVDADVDEIKSADFDGNDIQIFFTKKGSHLTDIALMGTYMYVIGWNSRRVLRISKESKTETAWMEDIPELGRLDSIKLYPGDAQPKNSVCGRNNGGCSTFCLPTTNGGTCACEDGVELRNKKLCMNVCPTSIKHALIKQDCVVYPGASCDYTCTGHLRKNPKISTIKCLHNAKWNINEKELCTETQCDKNIPSVYLSGPCNRRIGDKCSYTCRNGKANTYTRITCSSGGVWYPNTNLCKDKVPPVTKRCVNNIQHGSLDFMCSRVVGVRCTYTCNGDYESAYHEKKVRCLPSLKWNVPLDKICISIQKVKQTPLIQDKQTDWKNDVAIVGGILGLLIVVVVVIILIGTFYVIRKSGSLTFKENKLKGKSIEAHPAEDFSKHVKDEGESASGFQNPLSNQGSAFVVMDDQRL